MLSVKNKSIVLSVIMLSVIMLSVIMLSVIMLSVVVPGRLVGLYYIGKIQALPAKIRQECKEQILTKSLAYSTMVLIATVKDFITFTSGGCF